MRQRDLIPAFVLAASVVMLAGCGDQFSLTSEPPDEFRVVTRAPLAIPPDFALRPPDPGATRPQEGTATQQARTAVFRATDENPRSLDEVIPNDGRTTGERALLMAAGADQADPEIRAIVDHETRALDDGDGHLYDLLVFWRDDEQLGQIVDAEAEAKRLRENAALGKPVTAGETPTIERKKKAIFEDVF